MRKVYYVILLLLGLTFVGWLFKDALFPYYKVESRSVQQQEYSAPVVGWIRVQGTNIDYPIVVGNDAGGSLADYTWMQYDPSDTLPNRLAIFGHNIQNVSSHPLISNPEHSRFEQLMGFVYTEFAKKNQYIQVSFGEKDYLYRIYAVEFVKENDAGASLPKQDLKDYIQSAKEQSYYDYDVKVSEDDPLLTLITCTRFFGPTTEYEFKVEARLVRPHEKVVQGALKETDAYQEIKKILKEGESDAEV